ncbi:SHOCT domain-containing protein, partial [Candidatus Sumerlaeota bacterium]|nr:SHOCT domain-containing protein [Candidatus Sumerlaeota bacterium]
MTNWIDKLEQAKRLMDAGALTPEEFETEKAKLLPRPPQGLANSDQIESNSSEEALRTRRRRRQRNRKLAGRLAVVGLVSTIIFGIWLAFENLAGAPDSGVQEDKANINGVIGDAVAAPTEP